MRKILMGLAPALVLGSGVVGESLIYPSESLELATPLAEFPERLAGYQMVGVRTPSADELRVLRADDFIKRVYRDEGGESFRLSVAYYGQQLSGSSIHSPRNCLPGSGWEPVEHSRIEIATPYGPGVVSRYLVEHESGARALVYYWYQGRGRLEASEYLVKWDLLRDAVVRRRTDEALVRLVFPLRGGAPSPASRALEAVTGVAHALESHLPS